MQIQNFVQFTKTDQLLWLGILAVGAIFIVLMSLFTDAGLVHYISRFVVMVFMIFLPGYVILKLFFDHIEFTEYKVIDKFLVSLFLSIASVQTLYFLSTYIRTYGLNVDEDVISSDKIAVFIAVLVMTVAVGIKFYLNKKNLSAGQS
jgi:uncharacterized membrane protein